MMLFRRIGRIGLPLLAIALVGAFFTQVAVSEPSDDHAAHDHAVGDDEPFASRRADSPFTIADGTTTAGRKWAAVTYQTNGGYPCVDVSIEGSGTSAGGCFAPSGGPVQWGAAGVPGDVVVFGQVATGVPGQVVAIPLMSGRVATAVLAAKGVFAVRGDDGPSGPPEIRP